MDADRLDSMGALGPVRAAATRWNLPLYTDKKIESAEEKDIKSIFQDFSIRVPKIYNSLWTKSARQIARSRIQFLRVFIKEYEKEAHFMLKSFHDLEIE
ncbi:hypothetical protein HYW42_02820 [Candidatus Daviesbacteria bacterium]|nr:hypothetical protein [Candidatus Daviesbacteria bacterium]